MVNAKQKLETFKAVMDAPIFDIIERLVSHPAGICLTAWVIGQIGSTVDKKRSSSWIGLRRLGTSGFATACIVSPVITPIMQTVPKLR